MKNNGLKWERSWLHAVSSWIAFSCCVGCGPQEKLEHYRLPKVTALEEQSSTSPDGGQLDARSSSSSDRMLAAMVPTESKVWFLKLTGPTDLVGQQAELFRQLIQSITFDSPDANPEWSLPEGWTARPAGGMRFATLRTAAGDVSVISLPAPQDVNANIERWRGQLRLPPMSDAEPPERMMLGDYEAVLVDLVGQTDPSKMMTAAPPFAAGAETSPAKTVAPKAEPSVADGFGGFTFDLPDGWKAGRAGGMRRAAFDVHRGEQSAEITVITLPGQAGNVLSNVNRWRGQVGLPPVDEAELERMLEDVPMSGGVANYVQLSGPQDAANRQSILAAMLFRDDVCWFFKMTGPTEIVEHERGRFDSFLSSVTIQNLADQD